MKKFKSTHKRKVPQNRKTRVPAGALAPPQLGASGLKAATVKSGGRMSLSNPSPPVRREVIPLRDAAQLEQRYAEDCQRTNDSIHEHLPVLRELAGECQDIIEFGVKIARSSVALLLGARGCVYSYDIVPTKQARQAQTLAGAKWVYRIEDSCKATLPPCDMLFIDSLHTYAQLKAELAHAAHLARRYLVFHDTVTFGRADAIGETGQAQPGTKGIMPAIEELLDADKTWKLKHHYKNNNGLLVLERDRSTCVVVFTTVFGDRTDTLKDPELVNPYCRYICFSDRPQPSKVWETWEMPLIHNSPTKQARCVKVLGPDTYLPEYGFNLWTDASFQITCDPVVLGREVFADGADMAMFLHPDRSTIEAEAQTVIRLCAAPSDLVLAQVARYRGEGFKQRKLSTTGFLFRRNTERTRRFNQIWWDEIDRGTVRDQISVDFAVWKSGAKLAHMSGTYRDNQCARFLKWKPLQKRG